MRERLSLPAHLVAEIEHRAAEADVAPEVFAYELVVEELPRLVSELLRGGEQGRTARLVSTLRVQNVDDPAADGPALTVGVNGARSS